MVPGVAVKVATSGVVVLGFVHLTFTGVAGAVVVGAVVVGAVVVGAVGVIVLDDADAVDVPAAFVAFTVNV